MVHGQPFAAFLIVLKERELDYPQEVITLGDDIHPFRTFNTQGTQCGKYNVCIGIGYHQYHVTGDGAGLLQNSLHFFLCHEFGKA